MSTAQWRPTRRVIPTHTCLRATQARRESIVNGPDDRALIVDLRFLRAVDSRAMRARREDVLPLAQRFVREAAERMGKRVSGLTVEAAERLLVYRWPGNLRELHRCIARAVAITEHDPLVVEDLGDRVLRAQVALPQARGVDDRDRAQRRRSTAATEAARVEISKRRTTDGGSRK